MSYNPFTLIGKTILITGASSGIGKATAIECSKMGARVIITGRNPDKLNSTFQNLENQDLNHEKITFDLADKDNLVDFVEKIAIKIDGIVHSAGIVSTVLFPFINKDKISSIMDVNFFAPTLLTQLLLKKKKFNKEASVVFLSSIDGPITCHAGNSMYAASKGAISAVARGMAVDLAHKKIRVNCVLPGMTETPLIYNDSISPEQLELDKDLYPLKRYGKPEEIAHAIIYFLSDASSWVTGCNFVIDGGFTLV